MPSHSPPAISPLWLGGFRFCARWLFKRKFRALRVHHEADLPAPSEPVLIYANHPGWWDPIVATLLAKHWYPRHRHYFPMDAKPMKRQFGFNKIGFLPVARDKPAGAKRLLQWSRSLLQDPGARLWITPQALLTDHRVRPLRFLGGLEKITSPDTLMLPVAVEYTFWDHAKPEALVLAGEAHPAGSEVISTCTTSLELAMNKLSILAQKREASAFDLTLP